MNRTLQSSLLLGVLFVLVVVAPASARVEAGYVDSVVVSEFSPLMPYPAANAAGPFLRSWEIHRPGATFVKIHFSEFDLAPGDRVVINSPDGRQVHEYDGRGPRGDGDFWAFAVDGEAAVITLTSYGLGGNGFNIDQVGVGTPIRTPRAVCGSDGREDVACYPGAKTILGPVGRALFQDGPFFFVCTGFLVRGSNGSTFMTNQHCIDDQSGTNTLEVRFNYQNANCGGNADDPFDTFDGNQFLITDVGLDYTLVTLSGNPEGEYGEFIATRQSPSVGDRMALPQHSGGDEKTIAVFESANRSGGVCLIDGVRRTISGWDSGSQIQYSCDMEGGASGSPIVGRDQGHEVIGINHVETINCSGGNGNYGTHMDDICDDAGGFLNCSN